MVIQQMTRDQFVATPIAVSEFRNNPAASAFDSVNANGAHQINKRGLDILLLSDLIKSNVGNAAASRQMEGNNASSKEPMVFGVEATRKIMLETTLKASKNAVLEFAE
jgi:hypothetical protein